MLSHDVFAPLLAVKSEGRLLLLHRLTVLLVDPVSTVHPVECHLSGHTNASRDCAVLLHGFRRIESYHSLIR